jgi:hypothetical protein
MKPPIIVDEHGDLTFYASAREAEAALEPVDVENGEYTAYDSEGRILNLQINKKTVPAFFGLFKQTVERVSVESAEDEPRHAGDLRAALASFLERLGEPAGWLRSASLKELVEKGIDRCGLEPRAER